MKTIEQYFPVALFTMLCKVVLNFETVGEIVKYDHSNESYWAVLSCGALYYAVHGGSCFWVCGWNPEVWPFKWKLLLVFTWRHKILKSKLARPAKNIFFHKFPARWHPLCSKYSVLNFRDFRLTWPQDGTVTKLSHLKKWSFLMIFGSLNS